jgi:hypothetical protein
LESDTRGMSIAAEKRTNYYYEHII